MQVLIGPWTTWEKFQKFVLRNDELYNSNFKFLPVSQEIVFPSSDSKHRELGMGWNSDEKNLSDKDRALQRDLQKMLERMRQQRAEYGIIEDA